MLRPPDPATHSPLTSQIQEFSSPIKRPRTAEDFLRFCDVVLSYTNYPHGFYQKDEDERKIESPLNSIGESAHVSAASDTSSRTSSVGEADTDEDAWGMVTCWCGKPFAGRPMIECESCLIWLHLSCARVRKSNIPKHFKCAQCKPPKVRRKRQSSENSEMDGHTNELSHHSSSSSSTKASAGFNGTSSSLSATHGMPTGNSVMAGRNPQHDVSMEDSPPYGSPASGNLSSESLTNNSTTNHHRHQLLGAGDDEEELDHHADEDDELNEKMFDLSPSLSSSSSKSHHQNNNNNKHHQHSRNSSNSNHHSTHNNSSSSTTKGKNSKSRRSTSDRSRPRSSKKTHHHHKNKIMANDDALSVRLSYNASSPLSSN